MKQDKRFPWLAFIGVASIGGMIVALEFGVSQTLVIVIALLVGLIIGAMTLWHHANANATGDEWWQDDSCSGWRGY